MVRYETPAGENAVQFDALVEALRCRQTDAEWPYRYLKAYSVVEALLVVPDVDCRFLEPALRFALKLLSGRLADTRDLVVISLRTEYDRIERPLHRDGPEPLRSWIETVLQRLDDGGVEDSSNGTFQQQERPEHTLSDLRLFLEARLDRPGPV